MSQSPMGDRRISELITNPNTESGAVFFKSITPTVRVSTGAEVRPTAPVVFWLGGAVKPTNMDVADVWFSTTNEVIPPTDTQPPTAPSSVVSSSITTTSFNLSWTASSDNVAVTAYDVYLGGVLYTTTSVPSVTISGRTENTTYAITVRAKDAVGNVSQPSTSVNVKTLAASVPIAPRHSIFSAESPYPYTLTKTVDAGKTVRVGTTFYATSNHPAGWSATGIRFYLPTGVVMPTTATVGIHVSQTLVSDDLKAAITADPATSGTLTGISTGWNEHIFATPIPFEKLKGFIASIQFGATGEYLAASGGSVGTNPVQSTTVPTFYQAEEFIRSYFNYIGETSGSTSATWGLDLILQEPA